MDKKLLDIYNAVQKCYDETLRDKEKCYELLKTAAPGDQRSRLDLVYGNLDYRSQRLTIVLEILNGRAYTVAEKNGDLIVIKDSPETAKLVTLAQKMGLKAEFVAGAVTESSWKCGACGSLKFWLRDKEKVCGVCHPEPAA